MERQLLRFTRSLTSKLTAHKAGKDKVVFCGSTWARLALATRLDQKLVEMHSLHSKWVLWFLKGDRNRSWEDCLKRVAVLESVEDFWGLYSNIQPASGLGWGSDYYLFREGIKPMWEDPANLKGGRWITGVDRSKRTERLDTYWLELMMALVGEQFSDKGEMVCGAVVNVRQKGDKVALWTRDGSNDEANIAIGNVMREKLSMSDAEQLRYEIHKDASARTSSAVKPKLTLPAKAKTPRDEKAQS